MIFDEKDYLNLESQAEAPVIALASLLCKIYEENFAIDTDDKFLNQRATRFILAILSKKEGLNQHELTKISHLKGATISIALSHLEENDIIYRVPDRYDHRSFKVYLTPKGADIDSREHIITGIEVEADYRTGHPLVIVISLREGQFLTAGNKYSTGGHYIFFCD